MKALVTGITGQDGSYLSEHLINTGIDVYGVIRRGSTFNTERLDKIPGLVDKLHLVYGDLSSDVTKIIGDIEPDYIFNLGAMSHVRVSFDVPEYTLDINGVGPLRILEALRYLKLKNTRFYQASSSEMFGSSPPPQNETTSFNPCSPYGIAKIAGYHVTRLYRDAYGMFASNGILFNHESPRRGETFVTKKIVRAATRIKLGKQDKLTLGNLDAKRDWGHSKDYVRAMLMILQHTAPDDFVVATNEFYSVRDFLYKVFEQLNLEVEKYVSYDPIYLRPKEVPELRGDSSKIKKTLGWEASITLEELIKEMIEDVMKEESVGN